MPAAICSFLPNFRHTRSGERGSLMKDHTTWEVAHIRARPALLAVKCILSFLSPFRSFSSPQHLLNTRSRSFLLHIFTSLFTSLLTTLLTHHLHYSPSFTPQPPHWSELSGFTTISQQTSTLQIYSRTIAWPHHVKPPRNTEAPRKFRIQPAGSRRRQPCP
jgi:hypothetical protein